MKSLSIYQPWATAIASFGKTVENRGWVTHHRGLLAIHAARNAGTKWEFDKAVESVAALSGLEPEGVLRACAVRGAVVAVATLTGVCSDSYRWGFSSPLHCDCGPWAQSQSRHFILADVRPLAEPVPAKGAQMLWTLPAEVEAAVRARLPQEVAQ